MNNKDYKEVINKEINLGIIEIDKPHIANIELPFILDSHNAKFTDHDVSCQCLLITNFSLNKLYSYEELQRKNVLHKDIIDSLTSFHVGIDLLKSIKGEHSVVANFYGVKYMDYHNINIKLSITFKYEV